jgi:hypothetical protein
VICGWLVRVMNKLMLSPALENAVHLSTSPDPGSNSISTAESPAEFVRKGPVQGMNLFQLIDLAQS